jgi:hypothetical protein
MLDKLLQQNVSMAEKLLKDEKERRRDSIVLAGREALSAHVEALNKRIGKPYMPQSAAVGQFAEAVKGLKSLASMEDKVATELARGKIDANRIADGIQVNLNWLRENAKDFTALFPDTSTIVLKAHDDLVALAQNRITAHKQAEAERLEAEREKIRKEEQDKLAREQAERERQQAQEAQEKLEREYATLRAAGEYPYFGEALEAAKAGVALQFRRSPQDAWLDLTPGEEMNAHWYFRRAPEAAKPAPTPAPAQPAVVSRVPAGPAEPRRQDDWANPPNVVPLGTRQPKATATPPTLKLGQIGERLGFALTADFLKQLGFEPAAKEKSALLFHEHQYPLICEALIAHVRTAQAKFAEAA